MHSLRDQSIKIRQEVLFEIQEAGRVQEELSAIQQNVLSLPPLQNRLKLRLTAHHQPSVPPKETKHKQV